MKKITYHCDRCGKPIKCDLLGYVSVNDKDPETDDVVGTNPFENMDFCEECIDAIKEFVKAPCQCETIPAAPIIEREAITRTYTKWTADLYGKLVALKRAGWTLAQIAEEFKTSTATVSKKLSIANDMIQSGELTIETKAGPGKNPLEFPAML